MQKLPNRVAEPKVYDLALATQASHMCGLFPAQFKQKADADNVKFDAMWRPLV